MKIKCYVLLISCVLFMSVFISAGNIYATDYFVDSSITDAKLHDQGELQPLQANYCGYDYDNMQSLYDALGYGNPNGSTFSNGYYFRTGYSHNYIPVYLYDPSGNWVNTYYVLHA